MGVGVSFTQLLVSFGFVVAAVLFVRTKRHCAIHPNLLRAMIWRDTAYFTLQFFTSIPFTRSGKLAKLNSGKLHENLLPIIKFKILFNCVNDEVSWSVSLGSPWKSKKLYFIYYFILLFCHTQWITSRTKTIMNRLTNIKFKICALLGRSDCGGEISEKPSLWGIEISPDGQFKY